jgi:hypothetical protein
MEIGARSARRPSVRGRPAYREVAGLGRVRRVAVVAALVALIPVFFSYLGAVTERSNSPFGIRTVEWLRDNGAAGIVAKVESIYYSLTAPSKGGPTLKALPQVGASGSAVAAATRASVEYRPPRVAALIRPALPGEGVWHATRPSLEREPPVLVTTVRNQPEYPRVLAGIAWINTKRTTVTLNPGRLEPSVSLPRGPMEVPRGDRARLLATFNSGFKIADAEGGFAVGGHTYARLRNGQGTLVGYADGSVNVIDWHYGATIPAGVSFARQNLPLIVDEGRPNPRIANDAEWGATLGNAVLVWRSAVGVDAHGNLIYVAGEDQSVSSLAHTLIDAGAVRAMELDINSFWVSFITYGAPDAERAKNLLPSMDRSAGRYLEPDDRDFFAVYSR